MGRAKKLIGSAALMVVSFALGLLLCELVSRIFLHPADFLGIEPVNDKILGMVPSAATRAGYDAWGFRNTRVPDQADIVAIGDSHTYGNTVRMQGSWPILLGQLVGHSSYNMGMGGYGPNQYFYLLKTKALSLKPKLVLCGLWMGDDFENAYQITYGLDYWAYLRKLPSEPTNYHIWETQGTAVWHKRLRVWLSRHSVVYQVLFHGSLLGRLQGEAQIKVDPKVDRHVASLVIPEKNILEAFRPEPDARALDQQNPDIQEGMRVTFELLQQMNDICDQNKIKFVVVIIPTKNTVFAPYLQQHPELPLSDVLRKVTTNELLAREKTFEFLSKNNIAYVDTLPALQAAVDHQLYARTSQDMHPGPNGHRVVANRIADSVRAGNWL